MIAEAIVATTSPAYEPINKNDSTTKRNRSNAPSAQRSFSNLYFITSMLNATAMPISSRL